MAKARWYRTPALPDDDFDPFADVDYTPQPPVCPTAPSTDALRRELADLVKQEAALDAMGVTCPIKHDPEGSCLACPVRRTDPRDPRFRLCEIGARQEQILGLLAARRHEGS